MPLGRVKNPGPSPFLPNVLMKLPSASKISTRSLSVSVTNSCRPVHRHALRRRKVAWRSKGVVLSAGPDAPQQLESVGVIDNDLILLRVHNIEKTVLGIDCQADRVHQPFCNLILHFMLGVEDQDVVQLAVGDKQPVVVIDALGR